MSFVTEEVVAVTTIFENYFSKILGKWVGDIPNFLDGYDRNDVFLTMVNLYLKDADLEELLSGQCFLRIHLQYHDERKLSCWFSAVTLPINKIADRIYRELIGSCPSGMIPLTIKIGSFWHYLGLNQEMVELRRVNLALKGFHIFAGRYQEQIIPGMRLLARDAYPREKKSTIPRIQETQGIVIFQRKIKK